MSKTIISVIKSGLWILLRLFSCLFGLFVRLCRRLGLCFWGALCLCQKKQPKVDWSVLSMIDVLKKTCNRPFLAGLERKLAIVPAVSQAQRTTSWMLSDVFFVFFNGCLRVTSFLCVLPRCTSPRTVLNCCILQHFSNLGTRWTHKLRVVFVSVCYLSFSALINSSVDLQIKHMTYTLTLRLSSPFAIYSSCCGWGTIGTS